MTRRVFVVQPGARLHYAMPRLFAEAGLLGRLHTDLHADHGWLRAIDRAVPKSAQPRMLRRLLGRRLPDGLPAALVQDRAVETFARGIADAARMPALGSAALPAALLRDLEASDVGPGDIVYTVLINEDLDAMRRLKNRGAKIVHECIIGPDVGLLLEEEDRRFPGLEPAPDMAAVHAGRALDAKKYALADLILVPSTFTAAAVADLNHTHTPVANVPYGFDLAAYAGAPPAPEPGRVLFVGTVGLRKGNPDLAEASRILAPRDPRIAVRVVGPRQPCAHRSPGHARPALCRASPRARRWRRNMPAPTSSCCRRSATVSASSCSRRCRLACRSSPRRIAAISCVTGSTGSSSRRANPALLAERIAQLVGDRALRARMSANARARVADFSLDAYRARLLAAIATL